MAWQRLCVVVVQIGKWAFFFSLVARWEEGASARGGNCPVWLLRIRTTLPLEQIECLPLLGPFPASHHTTSSPLFFFFSIFFSFLSFLAVYSVAIIICNESGLLAYGRITLFLTVDRNASSTTNAMGVNSRRHSSSAAHAGPSRRLER